MPLSFLLDYVRPATEPHVGLEARRFTRLCASLRSGILPSAAHHRARADNLPGKSGRIAPFALLHAIDLSKGRHNFHLFWIQHRQRGCRTQERHATVSRPSVNDCAPRCGSTAPPLATGFSDALPCSMDVGFRLARLCARAAGGDGRAVFPLTVPLVPVRRAYPRPASASKIICTAETAVK